MSNVVNPNQLKMFMTPKEIRKQYVSIPGDRQYYEGGVSHWMSDRDTWRMKLREAKSPEPDMYGDVHGSSMYDTVKQRGPLAEPVWLSDKPVGAEEFGSATKKPVVLDGHHRIAATAAARPNDLMPVIYHAVQDIHEMDSSYFARSQPRFKGSS